MPWHTDQRSPLQQGTVRLPSTKMSWPWLSHRSRAHRFSGQGDLEMGPWWDHQLGILSPGATPQPQWRSAPGSRLRYDRSIHGGNIWNGLHWQAMCLDPDGQRQYIHVQSLYISENEAHPNFREKHVWGRWLRNHPNDSSRLFESCLKIDLGTCCKVSFQICCHNVFFLHFRSMVWGLDMFQF